MAAMEAIPSSTSASAAATAAALGEVEDEGLLASLFRDRFPEAQWRERPDVGRYLRELSGSGLERLRREPERLAEERAQLLQQTRDLAFANYKTFIRGAECTERIHRLFGDVEASLSCLLDRLPSFQQSCRNFVKEAEEINSNRRMNTLTLNRHTEILEILEIPQLMDTCVRNSYYEEALELATYVRRLERKYSSIPVIQGIVDEVRQSMQLMLSQLIQQLRTNIQLPACLRVIGFLRRMDIFTEAELRVKFLQARDAWLRSILTAIPNDDPYFHITKTIEACRVHLFDIITQYRAIFSDEDPLLSPAMGEHTVNESAIFHGWVLQKVSQFLQVLEADLQQGIGSRLDSLLGQCMYFGLSFSRVGADFRGQLAPVFQRVAISTFQRAVQEAVEKFQEEMNSYTLILAPAILGSGNLPAAVPVTQPGTLQPPMVLLDFPPLACFLNNILVAFNDLRLCCPIALAQDVTRTLEDALAKVTKVILAFHRAEEAAFTNGEQELFVQFCTVFLEDLVPYLNRCLQVLFPPAQIAQTLGIPPTQLSKYGNLGHVSIGVVQEPLAFILPKKEMVFCIDEKEPVLELTAPAPELTAPAPELPEEESRLDPRGEQVVWQASGWAARIIQHEMDHLQGCLFIDKMDSKTFTNIHWMEVND
ncbi:conserved oligomeric Golgi complex subunit 8 isoform X2 [Saccopteryx bilineata]|uniref:conserved oligomeric Golgi complex subunit 8 isoform X2 n=1 Tax=Saccopteryx bilineata TaxID=59482 RepID=UPI0033901425